MVHVGIVLELLVGSTFTCPICGTFIVWDATRYLSTWIGASNLVYAVSESWLSYELPNDCPWVAEIFPRISEGVPMTFPWLEHGLLKAFTRIPSSYKQCQLMQPGF
jgi:hypothetical protein